MGQRTENRDMNGEAGKIIVFEWFISCYVIYLLLFCYWLGSLCEIILVSHSGKVISFFFFPQSAKTPVHVCRGQRAKSKAKNAFEPYNEISVFCCWPWLWVEETLHCVTLVSAVCAGHLNVQAHCQR